MLQDTRNAIEINYDPASQIDFAELSRSTSAAAWDADHQHTPLRPKIAEFQPDGKELIKWNVVKTIAHVCINRANRTLGEQVLGLGIEIQTERKKETRSEGEPKSLQLRENV